MSVDLLYKKYAVKVNNGSGCLIQPCVDKEYTYVITAKHNIELEEFPSVATVENRKLNVINIFYHEKLDLAIIQIDFEIDIRLLVLYEIPDYSILFLYGYPENKRQDAYIAKKVECKLMEQKNNDTFSVLKSQELVEQEQVSGFSGCGVFQEINGEIYLVGIECRMDSYYDTQGRLNFLPIEHINQIIEENGIAKLEPKVLDDFDQFTNVSFDYKVQHYANNRLLKKLLSELAEGKYSPISYYTLPPFFLGNIVKAFDINSEIEGYKLNRKFGENRYRLIRSFFYSYLDLCRYSILSILWDEIKNGLIDSELLKNNVYALLVPANQNTITNIKTLSKLCEEIIVTFGKRKEKIFIEALLPSLVLFEKGIAIYEIPLDGVINNNELFWKSEQLLHQLIRDSQFLNNYRLRSVHSRYYLRHRSDEKEKYEVEYSWYGKKAKRVFENNIDAKFVNIHSIYLCQKEKEKDIVINLSPFYFDMNSYDIRAKKMDLYVLNSKKIDDEELEFIYKPIFDPNLDIQLDIQISVNNLDIDSEGFEYEKSELEKLKSKELFKQLNSLVKSLSESNEL